MAHVTFKNSSNTLRYVMAFQGPDSNDAAKPCEGKKTPLPPFSVGQNESRDAEFTQGTKLCYGLSVFPSPEMPPYFVGTAADGETIDLAKPPKPAGRTDDLLILGSPITYPINAPHGWKPPYWDFFFPKPPAGTPPTVATETVIAIWRDVLTPPHTRTRCTKEAWGTWPWGGEWRTCVEWATDCQWMECRLILRTEATANGITLDKLRDIVNECLKKSATAAALAALVTIYTGGGAVAAAQAVFVEALTTCLTGELAGAVFKVEVRQSCNWTEWTAC